MNVRKSDGSIEEFESQKVKNGICKAFEAMNEDCDETGRTCVDECQ